jgi:enediyne biosynthesis protein E4
MCIYGREANRLYLNRGNGSKPQFVDAARQLGVGEAGTPSRAMAAVDLDNDGRMDLVTTRMFKGPMIHRNAAEPSEDARWVGLSLKGDGKRCNAEGIGSRVELSFTGADGKRVKLTDEMQVMTGFGAQGDRRIHFGLGNARGKVHAAVTWCGQWREEYGNLPVDRYLELKQGAR